MQWTLQGRLRRQLANICLNIDYEQEPNCFTMPIGTILYRTEAFMKTFNYPLLRSRSSLAQSCRLYAS